MSQTLSCKHPSTSNDWHNLLRTGSHVGVWPGNQQSPVTYAQKNISHSQPSVYILLDGLVIWVSSHFEKKKQETWQVSSEVTFAIYHSRYQTHQFSSQINLKLYFFYFFFRLKTRQCVRDLIYMYEGSCVYIVYFFLYLSVCLCLYPSHVISYF